MTPEQETFLTECPAWARKAGCKNIEEWRIIKTLASLGWPDRHDRIQELSWNIEHVLRVWDELTEI